MKHISIKYRCLQDAITNQDVRLRKVGKKHNVADGLTMPVNQQVPSDMLTTLKSTCPLNMIVVKSIQKELMGEQNSTPGAGRRQSQCWAHEHREGRERKIGK